MKTQIKKELDYPAAKNVHNKHVSIQSIADKITITNVDDFPKIIISIGPIRSGTTASLRLYAESGIKSYSQPIKSIFRTLSKGKKDELCNWTIPDDKCIYVKETLGPFNTLESILNPIEVLFEVIRRKLSKKYSGQELIDQVINLMKKKIHLVVMGRPPLDTWCSNIETYHKIIAQTKAEDSWYYQTTEKDLLDNFILAYQFVDRVKFFAKTLGIKVSHYVAEANKYPEITTVNLFKRLEVSLNPQYENWTSKSLIGQGGSNVFITPDHDLQNSAGLFDRVNDSNKINFFEKKIDHIPKLIEEAITSARLDDLYNNWRLCTENELSINLD